MRVGTLSEIWQYPVKSLSGQRLEQAVLTTRGIPGDRCWALVDAASGEIGSAKRWPALLNLHATLSSQPASAEPMYDAAVPDAVIQLPDGTRVNSREPQAAAKLSDYLGRAVRIEPLAPPDDKDHYRLAQQRDEASFAAEMGLLPGEAAPDFSSTPAEILNALAEHATPPGTYFDAFPLHLLTTQSLDYLAQRGGVQAVVPRFRPNLLVQTDSHELRLTENDWLGRRLRIGDAVLAVNSRTVRCSMPAREQLPHGLAADRSLTRAMVEHCDRQLGVNLLIETAGSCRVGDLVTLLD